GNFTVTLAAANSAGSDTLIRTDYVLVSPASAPDADFIANATSGYIPFAVHFTDLSTNTPASWSWDFGDGSSSPVKNPVYTYLTAGTYTVRLTVVNAAGTDSKTLTEYITVVPQTMPDADFAADITSGTAPLTVDFTDLSGNGTYWAWYFGDGYTSNAPDPYPHTYVSPGTYDVRLIVSNNNGSSTALRSGYIHVSPAEELEDPVVPASAPASVPASSPASSPASAPASAPAAVPSVPVENERVSGDFNPLTNVPGDLPASSVPKSGPGEFSDMNGLSAAAVGSGGGMPGSQDSGDAIPLPSAIPLPADTGSMPNPLTFHTMLTSCGAISGTAMFRKFGDKHEFDKMVSYLLKATGLLSASIAFWLFSTLLM
ncbi:MAG: PKD domain-containing protein, partial [Methanomicrobiaceae archaeon]|nr:PKD domain-containing protein [Methanomicrobiaceae archaeon]